MELNKFGGFWENIYLHTTAALLFLNEKLAQNLLLAINFFFSGNIYK